jgi:DNA-binding LytR/AlgR family response regulator
MSKLKVALLEDSKELLKDLKYTLEEIGLVEVVAAATSSDEFLKKVAATKPDAVLLDIDLQGDAMSGLDVAVKLRLPVLFISGKMKDYYESVSAINIELKEVPVDYITKPASIDKLNAILPKFIQQVRAMAQPLEVVLSLKDEGRQTIKVNSIVCLCATKDSGSASNNKEIHFIDRRPALLIDFSFTAMEEKGLPKEQFLTIHKSFRVNANHVTGREGNELVVMAMDTENEMVEKRLPISENYQPAIRARYR